MLLFIFNATVITTSLFCVKIKSLLVSNRYICKLERVCYFMVLLIFGMTINGNVPVLLFLSFLLGSSELVLRERLKIKEH